MGALPWDLLGVAQERPSENFELNKDSPQAEGLVGWWPASEGVGNKVLEFSGYGAGADFTSETTEEPSWALFRDGPGLDFAVSANNVYARDTGFRGLPANQSVTSFAVAFWARASSNVQSAAAMALQTGATTSTAQIVIMPYDTFSGNGIRVWNGNGAQVINENGVDRADGAFRHFTITWGPGLNWKAYVNGILAVTGLTTAPQNAVTSSVALGHGITGGDPNYQGQAFDWRIWNYVPPASFIHDEIYLNWLDLYWRPEVMVPGFVAAAVPQFARPDGDISQGSWLEPPLWQKIDEETPDDNDFIYSAGAPSNDTCEVSLSDIGDPGVGTGHVVRYRYSKSLDQGQINLTVSLIEGTTTIDSWTHTDIPVTVTLAEQTLGVTEANSISDYSDLRLRFSATEI